jgi:hypothetical protein
VYTALTRGVNALLGDFKLDWFLATIYALVVGLTDIATPSVPFLTDADPPEHNNMKSKVPRVST